MSSVTFQHIYKFYKGESRPAVNNFHLQIEDGEFLVLVGPSGCGKSTTLRMLAGLEEVSRGELYIGDRFLNYVSPKNRDIAMVFQNYALYPNFNVYENMALGLKLRKVARHEVELRVNKAAKVLEIGHLLNKKPNQLSGGQKQRVALGRAIVREPQVFLMDEPLSNLDAQLRTQTRIEISKMHSQLKTTTLYVTHDQTEAMTMGTRIVVMKSGEIHQVASPQTLYDNPANQFVAGFIGSPKMNFIDGDIKKEDNHYYFQTKRLKLEIPERYHAYFEKWPSTLRNVILGLRPEQIIADQEWIASRSGWAVRAEIQVIEQMGSDTYLYMNIGHSLVISRVDAHAAYQHGEVINIAFNMDKAHFFDPNGGASICYLEDSLA